MPQKEHNHIMFLEALKEMNYSRWVPVTSFPHLCLPPILAEAAAEVVSNPLQKQGLIDASQRVAYPESELRYASTDPILQAHIALLAEQRRYMEQLQAEQGDDGDNAVFENNEED